MGIQTIVALVSGLALFLYGMHLLSEGLQKVAGNRMKRLLEILTSNRVIAVLAGAGITAIIQSSSATTVMVVGFVNAGIMNLVQAAGVIMGANIGTTVTAVLVAFQLEAMIPYAIIAGVLLLLFAKKKKMNYVGQFILGFGLLFMGMYSMSAAMEPLRTLPQFAEFIVKVQGNPILGVIAGMIITAVIQSSSAAIGIVQALAIQGLIPIGAALPILFGSNIGTCVTVILASIGTSITAKRASAVHLLFNVFGTVVFTLALHPMLRIVQMTSGDTVQQIANAHIIFNVTNTIILLPFLKQIVALVTKLIPGKDIGEEAELKFVDKRFLEAPSVAVVQLIKEIGRFAEIAEDNVRRAIRSLLESSESLVSEVKEKETIINTLEKKITEYLVELSNSEINEDQSALVSALFNAVHDIERIGDHADNLAEQAQMKIDSNIMFSSAAHLELENICEKVERNVELAVVAFRSGNSSDFVKVEALEQEIDDLEQELRNRHIERLNHNQCKINSGVIFLDVLTNLERISDHCVNIAESVVMKAHPHKVD